MRSYNELIKWVEENNLENGYNKFCIEKFGRKEYTPAEILISLQAFYNYKNID